VPTTVLITLGTGTVVVAIAVAFNPPSGVTPLGLGLFVLAGATGAGLGNWATVAAIDALGPSIAIPVAQGARPILALALAVPLLHETLRPLRLSGIVLIVVGGWQLSRAAAAGEEVEPGGRRWMISPAIAIAVTAGLGNALHDLIGKQALAEQATPTLGSLLVLGTGFVIWAGAAAARPALRAQISPGRGAPWAVVSGILIGFASLTLVAALDNGDVSVVSPISATQPLMIVALSRVALRGIEVLRLGTVLAGLLVVAGTVLVSATT